jgi:hypothetical protein
MSATGREAVDMSRLERRDGRERVAPVMRMSRRWRQGVLTLHVLASGAWIGIDVIVAVLVGLGWFARDIELRSLAYRALATFVVWPMLVSGLMCLATGLLLGLGTKWGLVRYWWVLVKLALNLTLCALILILLQPGMDDVATYGEDLLTGAPPRSRVAQLFFPPAVSLTCLTLATVLAVFKPWGRMARPLSRKRTASRRLGATDPERGEWQ